MKQDISTLVSRVKEVVECASDDDALRFIYNAVELRLDELLQPEDNAPAKFQVPDDDSVYCDSDLGGYHDYYEL